VLAFKKFGFATDEFEVTHEVLGVYRPEEHIDNPREWGGKMSASELHNLDGRLRSTVSDAGMLRCLVECVGIFQLTCCQNSTLIPRLA
jgi:hypothetical protein